MLAAAGNPPTGNQPVRAATRRSASEVTSDGTERTIRDSARGDRGREILAAAGDDSCGHAEDGRQQQRRHAEERRLARALGDEAADRPAVFEGLPQVEPGGAAEPVAIADEERPIEPEPVAFGRRDGGRDVEPAEIVAGRRLDEQERRGRDDDHEEYREQQPASQVRQEGAVHDGVFGSTGPARYGSSAGEVCDFQFIALYVKVL